MTSDQAQRIATEFAQTQPRFVFVGINRDERDRDLWTVAFRVPGLDGPTIVFVSDSTGKAEFFDDWFRRTRR